MSYAAGETLIKTQVEACSSFSSNTVTRADWLVLNSGRGAVYAILRPGPFEREALGMGGSYLTTWTTLCEVWRGFVDDQTTMTALQSDMQEITDRFDAYRKAADTTGKIQDVFVRRGGEPEEMWRKGGNGPVWLRQTLEIEWTEERSVTLQE